jgi:hypothetical protein
VDVPAETGAWYPQRSGLRYSFAATIEVVDPKSGKQIISTTSNLSDYGCRVRTDTPLDPGTKVKVTIRHRGIMFQSEGRVSHSITGKGMGIRFVDIDTAEQIVLREWLMQASNEAPDERLSRGNKESAASRHRKILVVCAITLAAIVEIVRVWLGVLR